MKRIIIILLLAVVCHGDTFTSHLKPNADSSLDIGTTSLLWRKIYADSFTDNTALWENSSLSGFTSIEGTILTDGIFIVSGGVISVGTWQGSTIQVPFGGTSAVSFTDGGLLVGSGTSAITALAVASNGQIPIGDGVTDPTLATLTGSSSILVTNGAGSITLSAIAAGIDHGGLAGLADDDHLYLSLDAEGTNVTNGTFSLTTIGQFTITGNDGVGAGNDAPDVLVVVGGNGVGIQIGPPGKGSDLSFTAGNAGSVASGTTGFGGDISFLGGGNANSTGEGGDIFLTTRSGAAGTNYGDVILVKDGGRVGIGTETPSTALHVVGATTSSSGFIIDGNFKITKEGNFYVIDCDVIDGDGTGLILRGGLETFLSTNTDTTTITMGQAWVVGQSLTSADNIVTSYGTTDTDMQLSSDGTNGIIDVATALRIGNITTNYINFADDGELTLAGTARVLRSVDFEPDAVKKGGVGPTDSTEDGFPIHDYQAANDESVHIHWEIP
ncbi:hypothetical protein LCGC14_1803610, partial [marine sediment metagenome]